MVLGAHFSAAGGICNALLSAKESGANAAQFFLRSPRNFKHKDIAEEEVAEFIKLRKELAIKKVVVHAVYMQNLASHKDKFHKTSIEANIEDVKEAHRIGADYYVLHLGSHKETTLENGLKKVIKGLQEIADKAPEGIEILVENSSGGRNLIGSCFKELGLIFSYLKDKANLGICVDTCHAWCQGYDLSQKDGLECFVKELEETVGLEKIKLIHLNDSKDAHASKRDCHASIGLGKIGKDALADFINHEKIKSIPLILETPYETIDDQIKDINVVKGIRACSVKREA